jgi:hypothetical protein
MHIAGEFPRADLADDRQPSINKERTDFRYPIKSYVPFNLAPHCESPFRVQISTAINSYLPNQDCNYAAGNY